MAIRKLSSRKMLCWGTDKIKALGMQGFPPIACGDLFKGDSPQAGDDLFPEVPQIASPLGEVFE